MNEKQEHENQEWLYAWLRHRVKYDKEYLDNIDKYKGTVRNLNFSWQNLQGKLVIENFPKLTTLNLGHNELEEVEIKNCPKLQNIIASHNQKLEQEEKTYTYVKKKEDGTEETKTEKRTISKEVEPTLKKLTITDCPEVRELYCSDNGLTDLDVAKLKDLKVLSYDNNKFTPEKQQELDALKLDKENPTGNPIKVLNNNDFINNPEVEEIDISNEAGWEGSLTVKNCPKLTSLVVDNCKLEKLFIINCPNLKTLSFRHNKISQVILQKLTKLENLYCSGNRLSGLNLINNTSLKNLVCDNNPIQKLKVKHLKELLTLTAFHCQLSELDCSGLDKLEELFCANNHRLKKLDVDGCSNLEILDCAENKFPSLHVSDKPKLKTISCKENYLKELTIKNCSVLEFLDFSIQEDGSTKLTIDNKSLKKVFHDKSAVVPDWKTFPNMELLRVGEEKLVKNEHGKNEYVYFTKETDFLAQRNTSRVIKIIANPNNYSIDDIIELDLYGVPPELREKLKVLVIDKLKTAENTKAQKLLENKENHPNFLWIIYLRLLNQDLLDQETKDKVISLIAKLENQEKESEDSGDENPNSKKPSELPTPQDIPTPPSQPVPKQKEPELDYKKLYFELLEKIKKGEITSENKEEIINSPLDESQKKELLRQLEGLTKKTTTNDNKTPLHYWGWLFVIVGWIVVVGLFVRFLHIEKNRKKS